MQAVKDQPAYQERPIKKLGPLPVGFRRQGSCEATMMKRFTGVIILLLAGWLLLGLPSSVASQGGTVVRVYPAEVTLEPGESETIEIWVDNVVGLFGFEMEVHFDPDVISADLLTLANFLDEGWIVIDQIDNENGIIIFHMTQAGIEVESKTGSGVLFQFRITLLEAVAESELSIEHVLLTDRIGVEIPCGVQNAVIRTPGTGPDFSVYLPIILR